MNKLEILKRLDAMLGPLCIRIAKPLRSVHSEKSGRFERVLFIRPGGIGDAVLLLPAIQQLKTILPGAMIDVLSEKRNSALFKLCTAVNRIFRYDAFRECVAVLRGNYDVIIDTEQWHRLSAVVARLTRAPMLIGYSTNERKKLFHFPVSYSQDDYEVTSFLHLLEPILSTRDYTWKLPFLHIPEEFVAQGTKKLGQISPLQCVALFPGGSIRERRWGNSNFHQVARQLSEKGYGIVVVGGGEDVRSGAEIVAGLSNARNLCGQLSLPETAAVLSRTALLVTGDSGIMHIGYGLGIKIVALFGPGREEKWAPRGENCIILNKHLSCSPCTTYGYTPRCKINAECMNKITIGEVVNASIMLLEKKFISSSSPRA